MSVAEIVSTNYSEVAPQPERMETVLADIALAATDGDGVYRPDFMTKTTAEAITDELRARGFGADVIATYLKGIRSGAGSSFAVNVFSYDDTVRPFPYDRTAA